MEDTNSANYSILLWLSIIFCIIIGVAVGATITFAVGDLLINSIAGGAFGAILGAIAALVFNQMSAGSNGELES